MLGLNYGPHVSTSNKLTDPCAQPLFLFYSMLLYWFLRLKFLLFLENKIFAYVGSVLADCYAVIIYFISSPKKIGMILVLQMGNGGKGQKVVHHYHQTPRKHWVFSIRDYFSLVMVYWKNSVGSQISKTLAIKMNIWIFINFNIKINIILKYFLIQQ